MTKSYIRGATLLASGMLIAKIIGAIYRIPLTNIIGAEGIGIYQMIFPVYALLITITSSGIPTTLSRVIAEKNVTADKQSINALFKKAVFLFLGVSVISTLLLICIAIPLSELQGNEYVARGYILIAPTIIISTIVATFRGYFQGYMNMRPSAIVQIVSQTIKLIAGLILASLLIDKGIEYAVWGAISAVFISELAALIVIIAIYLNKKKYYKDIPDLIGSDTIFSTDDRQNLKDMISIIIPITLGGIMLPFVQFSDSIMVVNLLARKGFDIVTSTSLYGILSGPVGSLINMPVVLTLAFAITAVPLVSSSRVDRDIIAIKSKAEQSVKLTFAIGVPCAIGIFFLSENIMRSLYPTFTETELALSSTLMQISSINIILLSLMQIYTALLQAVDKAYKPFLHMLIGAIVKIVLTIILVLKMGVMGVIFANMTGYIIVALLNIYSFNQITGKYKVLVKNTSTILLSGVIMGGVIRLVNEILSLDYWLELVIGFVLGSITYFVMISILVVFTKEELTNMPFSRMLLKATRLIRFWEHNYD